MKPTVFACGFALSANPQAEEAEPVCPIPSKTPMPKGPFLYPSLADDMGLVAIGGDLRPERLLEAYSRGIFPWYEEGGPIMWWSPNPRTIIEVDGLHISRRLQRTLRSGKFTITFNRDFVGVLDGCATGRQDGTWLTDEMKTAYTELHRLGYAHSVEAWCGDVLGGGTYGVALGGLFAAESMFTRITDGSKAALVGLMQRLMERSFQLLDIQFITDHTRRLGAIEIPRTEYLRRLREALAMDTTFA